MDNEDSTPRGIGGWLLLPLVFFALTPIADAFHIWVVLGENPSALLILFDPDEIGSKRWRNYALLFGTEVVAFAAVLALSLWLLVLYYRKSRRAPKLHTAWRGSPRLQHEESQ